MFIPRQPGLFQMARGPLKSAVRQSPQAALAVRASRMEDRFDIVQIEHRIPAHRRNLVPVRRAPEVLDDGNLVMAVPRKDRYGSREAAETVHERRYFPRQPHGVAHGTGDRVLAVPRQIQYANFTRHPGGKQQRGIRRAGLAKHDDVYLVALRQIRQD